MPTATPDQPGVKDGISREAGSWNSCGSFVGAMPGPGGLFVGMIVSPMGLFVGSNAQPWGAGFLGDACPHGAGVGADAQACCWSTQSTGKNAIVFLTPKISPASKPRHLSTPFSPTSPPGHPVGGAELPGSHPSCLHQASLLSLRGCEAGEAGAGTHCPNLPRLVLFQQDFQVPAVPAEPRRVGLGWAGLQRAQHEPGWQHGHASAGCRAWARGGLVATAPRAPAPAGCPCSRAGGERLCPRPPER